MNTIIINGKRIEVEGNDISISNGHVVVGGKNVHSYDVSQSEIHVKWEGDIASLKAGGSVTTTGEVKGNVDAKGSVHCGDVIGKVDAGGSIHCGNVGKSVEAGGNVSCRMVGGDVDAGGSIRMNR